MKCKCTVHFAYLFKPLTLGRLLTKEIHNLLRVMWSGKVSVYLQNQIDLASNMLSCSGR